MVQHLRLEGYTIPPNYPTSFHLAELTFLHQRVFDPESRTLVPLTPFPEGTFGEEEDRFIGPHLEDTEMVQGISRGEWNPVTLEKIVDPWPEFKPIAIKAPVNVRPPVFPFPSCLFHRNNCLKEPVGLSAPTQDQRYVP